jgi:integrase
MTFREDGTGNLVRVAPGTYRLKFNPDEFKNEKGAAKDIYDVEVDSSVAPWIDRYLTEARPYLVDATLTSRFLLSAAKGPRKVKAFLEAEGLEDNHGYSGEGLGARIKHLTSVYIDDCPGFGPHGFRHVIATDHLRRHPGDYLTVAKLLHDELATVLGAYGHTTVADGLRVLSSGIREASAQLAAMRTSSS